MSPPERMIPRAETTDGLSDLRRKLAASRKHVTGKVMTDQEIMEAEFLTERVALGVAQGFELLMTDDRLIDAFWNRGYKSFVNQGSNDTKRWAGAGFLRALVFSALLWLAIWTINHNGGARP